MAIPPISVGKASILSADVSADERVAAQTSARVLITGATATSVALVAERVHLLSDRERFPFVGTRAAALPPDIGRLTTCCAALLDATAGGSMLLSDIEEMSPPVQERFIEVLARLALDREPSAGVRLISGTTVSLRDRVMAGAFSARLFYQLNVIHMDLGRAGGAIRIELHNIVPAKGPEPVLSASAIHAEYRGRVRHAR